MGRTSNDGNGILKQIVRFGFLLTHDKEIIETCHNTDINS